MATINHSLNGDDEKARLKFLYNWTGSLMEQVKLYGSCTDIGQAYDEGRLAGYAFARQVAEDTLDALYPDWREEDRALAAMLGDRS